MHIFHRINYIYDKITKCVKRQKSSIILVGLPLNFDSEYERITSFMSENVETEVTVEMTFSQAMFFSYFTNELAGDKNMLERVEWFKKNGGIHVRGRARLVRKGNALMYKQK